MFRREPASLGKKRNIGNIPGNWEKKEKCGSDLTGPV
jgi:hypothetical protein